MKVQIYFIVQIFYRFYIWIVQFFI